MFPLGMFDSAPAVGSKVWLGAFSTAQFSQDQRPAPVTRAGRASSTAASSPHDAPFAHPARSPLVAPKTLRRFAPQGELVVGRTALRFSRARPYRAWLRDATRRAKRAAEAAGQTNGRASAATASWPALDSSLEQRSETVRTVLIRNSRLLRCGRFLARCAAG